MSCRVSNLPLLLVGATLFPFVGFLYHQYSTSNALFEKNNMVLKCFIVITSCAFESVILLLSQSLETS